MHEALSHILKATDAKATGPDKWLGHCAAHGSRRHRDLSIRMLSDRVLIHCFAGCRASEVVSAVGLTLADLIGETARLPSQQLGAQPRRVDLSAVAFAFELGALDRRRRAEGVLAAARNLTCDLDDASRGRAMNAVGIAYADFERAQLLEDVADALRWKAYAERCAPHAR